MNTRKLLIAASGSALALSLAACGGSSGGDTATSTDKPAAGGGAKNITLMVGVKGDPFYVSMECGAKEAADAAGAKLTVQGPDKSYATQQDPMLDAVAAS